MTDLDHPLQLIRLLMVGGFLCVGVFQLLLARTRRDPISVVAAIWSADVAVFVFARYLSSGAEVAGAALFGIRLAEATGLMMIPLAIQLTAAYRGARLSRVLAWGGPLIIATLPFLGYLTSSAPPERRVDLLGLPYHLSNQHVARHAVVVIGLIALLLLSVRHLVAVRELEHRRERLTVFRVSLAVMIPASINDLLMQNGIVRSVPLLDVALLVQMSTLVWLSSVRISQLRDRLEEQVSARTAELKRTVAGVSALLDMLPDTVLVYRRRRIIYANRAGEALLGYDHRELEGKRLDDLVGPAERTRVVGCLLEAGQGTQTAFTAELMRRDGTPCTGDVVASPAHYDHGPASVAVIRDASVRSKLERKLRTADRLASIGRLASGVGHEINNPLTTVIANLYEASEAAREVELPAAAAAELRQSLDDARRGADRVRGIVADLRQLSRTDDEGEEAMTALDLRHVVSQTVQLARYETRHRAEIHVDLGDVEQVLGNARRLGQLVLNLLVNAAEAMEGGRLGRIDVRVLGDRDAVVLEVEDNGRGMTPEMLSRAADPFYTTKDIGEGTGLGLALCYGVADSHGGALAINSELGAGTVVRLTLPAASTRFNTERIERLVAAPRLAPAPAVEVANSRRARVLIVDDEETLGKAFVRLLREHDATLVTSGAAALEAWDEEPFDVVVCDLMMPGMTGAELYEELCAREPAMSDRFIVVTGGAVTPETEEFLADCRLDVLYKPVPPPRLRDVVAKHVALVRARAVGAA